MSERISRETFRDKRGAEADSGMEEDYYPEDVYSPWKKGNVEGIMSSLTKSSGLLIVIIGVGAFFLLAFFVFLPMLKKPADAKPLAEMDARLKKMEARLTEMDQNYQKVAQLALQEDKSEQISARLDKLAASTTQRLDQMSKDIDSLRKQPSAAKPETAPKAPAVQPKHEPAAKHETAAKNEPAGKPAVAVKPVVTKPAAAKTEGTNAETSKSEAAPPPKPAETPEKKVSSEKIHVVKPKDTLYSISRTYHLSVDELKRLNNMGAADNTVRLGQKLKVGK